MANRPLDESDRRHLSSTELLYLAKEYGTPLSAAEQDRLPTSMLLQLARYGQPLTEKSRERLYPSQLVELHAIAEQAAVKKLLDKDSPLSDPNKPKRVFVAYGRNTNARKALFSFLRSIGLEPMEWGEIVAATGEGSPYVGTVLTTGFDIAQAAIILLTPDDEARLKPDFLQSDDGDDERQLTGQARPNVLLEAGMALGRYEDRTVIVTIGRHRLISDILGRHVIRLNNTTQSRQALIDRLQTAGCAVSIHGKTDWHTDGNFDCA